jgi:hypothetical protein
MKLPSFSVGKKQKEIYLSLLLYPDAVDAAAWEIDQKGHAYIDGAVTQELSQDSWDERNSAADKCVSTLETITKTENIQKVILGLPADYLTEEGDVKKEVKGYIKKITNLLELTPIGFVSIYQAIIHQFKQKEGVPPSLILLGITQHSMTVSLYKVGNFLGHRTLSLEGPFIGHLEDALASFTDIEILPSRILIYGTNREKMEDCKRLILEHHWHQKTNFLHFPKAELLPGDGAVVAVSFAGAAELGQTMIIDEEDLEEAKEVAQEEIEEATVAEDTLVDEESDTATDFTEDKTEQLETDQTEVSEHDVQMTEEDNNIELVEPEDVGFETVTEESEEETEVDTEYNLKRQPYTAAKKSPFVLLKNGIIQLLGTVRTVFSRNNASNSSSKKKLAFFLTIPILLVLLIAVILFTQILPEAIVSVKVVPKPIEATERLTVDIEAAGQENVVLGKNLEKSVSGEKSISVTGKKTIGDAAKGKVTIFNKSTLPRTFKKGTTISTGSLDFILDSDVQVASASETFTGSTFGKADANVTAKDIGSKGNIVAGKEFSISGVSSNIATARNESAFSGGTSKEMTVVSRADQDTLLRQLTSQLVEEAKTGFAAGDGQRLITETIKTQVKEKTFSHEIGQEAKELTGTATILISGTVYADDEVQEIMTSVLKKQISDGYKLSEQSVSVKTANAVINRAGDININATASGMLVPSFDVDALAKQISGKSKKEATDIIKSLTGVGDVTITISKSLFMDKLPRSNSIKISLSAE